MFMCVLPRKTHDLGHDLIVYMAPVCLWKYRRRNDDHQWYGKVSAQKPAHTYNDVIWKGKAHFSIFCQNCSYYCLDTENEFTESLKYNLCSLVCEKVHESYARMIRGKVWEDEGGITETEKKTKAFTHLTSLVLDLPSVILSLSS